MTTKTITMRSRRSGKILENAYILLASTRAALINGVKHYSLVGNLLKTEKEILKALRRDGKITFDINERIQRTTAEEQLEIVKKEYIHV
jgi:hypothetical protein